MLNSQSKAKIGRYLSYLMQFFIFIFIFVALYRGQYFIVLAGALALLITFMPSILSKKWGITLPWTLNFLIIFALSLHMWGLTYDFYTSYHPFYDKFGHFVGSIAVALLGFASVVILTKYTSLKFNKPYVIFFIIIFTLAIGAIWEIGEFAMDQIFAMRNQKSLVDTMYDLIFDFIGGLFMAVITNIKFNKMKKGIKFEKNYNGKKINLSKK